MPRLRSSLFGKPLRKCATLFRQRFEPRPVVSSAMVSRRTRVLSGQSSAIRVQEDVEEDGQSIFAIPKAMIEEALLPLQSSVPKHGSRPTFERAKRAREFRFFPEGNQRMNVVRHYGQCSHRPHTFDLHCVGEIAQIDGYLHQTNLSLFGNQRDEILRVR
jgi:hypothetical protein